MATMRSKRRPARRPEVEPLEGKQLLSSLSATATSTHALARPLPVAIDSALPAVSIEANVFVHAAGITNYYLQFRGGGYRFIHNFNLRLAHVGTASAGSVTAKQAVQIFLQQLYAQTGLTGPASFPAGVTVQQNNFNVRGSHTTYNLTFTDGVYSFSQNYSLNIFRAYGTSLTGSVTALNAVNIFGNNLASRVGVPAPLT
jgi:hypothetical protein